ncbi:hypothetical protein GGTG_08357 [Gaeumannomyces tritici R3-111a-1]|uniref:Uncharacterized protein n=1 Tax=Gaeumannomyces tritici (strain R3-111a-1) TaxID=644352 RepID=J3P4C1_GAET3|nr:hypothetical protein GGTG_08357 [Gaeumannomyces tritici R3-111a-1]EJT74517.1 hypothetical protein GGTG_08357 [Gaeumannomyces tritici R3-111a-1]
MTDYDVKGKIALVTGAGSGINHVMAQRLLEAGCSVMFADLKLRPEAEATVAKYPHPAPAGTSGASAAFRQTDVADWAQLTALWDETLAKFGRIDILVNGAGIYEPPTSAFWNPPGVSPLAEDAADGGIWKTFAVNTMAPIRLAQMALDYWTQNREVKGAILWVVSAGAYLHSIQTPLYFSSKAAVLSVVKSLQGLKQLIGVRSSAICPAAVRTPLFDQDHCKDRLGKDDPALTAEEVVAVMMDALTLEVRGNGDVIEVQKIAEGDIDVRDVKLEALYPPRMPISADTTAMAEELKFMQKVADKGMRSSYE